MDVKGLLLSKAHLLIVSFALYLGACMDQGGTACENNEDYKTFERLVNDFEYENITEANCLRLQQGGRALINKTRTCSDAFEIELYVRPWLALACTDFY